MRTSETIAELAKALSAAQGAMDDARKDSENPHFKNKYADLAAVRKATREALSKHGLAIVQLPMYTDHGVVLETRLIHASGEWIEGELPLTVQGNTMQNVVSAITYARRTSLAAITGIAPADDDDDGEGAAARGAKPPSSNRRAAAPAPEPVKASAPAAAAPPARAAAGDDRVISEGQRKRFYAISQGKGWSADDVKKLLASKGYASSKDIRVRDYDLLVKVMETGEYIPEDTGPDDGDDIPFPAPWETAEGVQ